jgi:hypothetical protein
MAMVKKKKAMEAHEAKKLAKQMAKAKLGFAKKLPKTQKGEMEKTFKPLNPESGEGGTSTKKESSKGEASKDNI